MWGSNLATPWSPTNTQYRQNVIIFVKRLRELGARPFLLLSTRPFTDGEAGDWWREASLYTDFVREIYFNARQIHAQGAILGSRTLRNAFRQGVTDLTTSGSRPRRSASSSASTRTRAGRPREASRQRVVQHHQAGRCSRPSR